MTATVEAPRVLRESPGRVRLHLPGWPGTAPGPVEDRLLGLHGVRRVRANPVTGNVLVEFDAAITNTGAVLGRLTGPGGQRWSHRRHRSGQPPRPSSHRAPPGRAGHAGQRSGGARATAHSDGASRPLTLHDRKGVLGRARIAVRGLDRDAELARRLVRTLRRTGAIRRVSASRLTGRVLVEFDESELPLEDLIAQVARLELPDRPGDDCPEHPLDPTPLIQSAARVTGAALGLALLGVRRAAGSVGPPTASLAPATIAAGASALEGLGPVRLRLRERLGRDRAELAFGAVNIVSLTFAGNPLGLAVTGAGALVLLTEVRARRAAWKAYEQRLADAAEAVPGETVRLEAGDRAPMAGRVLEGSGTMIDPQGLPEPLRPGQVVGGGARLCGGPFAVELHSDHSFDPHPRPAPLPPTHLDRYVSAISPVALGYAGLTALLTRSPSRTLTALLLVNARPALIGTDAANSAAGARVLRSGVTMVGRSPGSALRLPDLLLIDGARVLSDRRLEVAHAASLRDDLEASDLVRMAAGVAAASGSPWGLTFPVAGRAHGLDGRFEGGCAQAEVDGERLCLGPVEDLEELPDASRQRERGHYVLVLRREPGGERLGVVALRPRLAPGALRLVEACRQRGIRIELIGPPGAGGHRAMAERVGIPVLDADLCQRVRDGHRAGKVVALVSDSPHAAPALAAADIAVAFTSGRSGRFAARADLLAPDLDAVTSIVEAAARRRAAIDDAIALSLVSNGVGAVWGLRATPGIQRGAMATHLAALAAIGLAAVREAGGHASQAITARLADPDPERWGEPPVQEVFATLDSGRDGITDEQAAARATPSAGPRERSALAQAIRAQARSPINGALVAGAGVSALFGSFADVGLIAAVIAANAAVGIWQEHQAGEAAALLAREGASPVDVIRGGEQRTIRAPELVPGDVIALGSGDRVPADARLIESESLEVDEAALTGESLPVGKSAEDSSPAGRVVLEGSDVTVGSGTAVVFAVGENTRMGATAAALARVEGPNGTLDARLNRLMAQGFPLVLAGGIVATASGLIWGGALPTQLAVGASIITAAVPEGLPLLAGVAEAAVSRRLADRRALVRRLSAVEALGRVDIACTDKTGTLTTGRLEVTSLQGFDGGEPRRLTATDRRSGPGDERDILLAAALASPHPDASDAAAHPTDGAVIRAAVDADLGDELRVARVAEVPFDPARGFHATATESRVVVKGAAESLVPRCRAVRREGRDVELGKDGPASPSGLLAVADEMAGRGLRVLMVAAGAPGSSVEDPRDLVGLGLVGISDPLRESVPAAIRRCQEAGVRVIMLTGDHPETARAVAAEAGLSTEEDGLLTGPELGELDDRELDARLEQASVIARINPIDKLRIVERLQAAGHTVAMTGDGVNDAPALRLADVGVAMGGHGTEVARQASDVVLADDEFATLVETLVEGRSFWLNLRRSLGLLLGGNLGEVGLVAGATLVGLNAPLNTRQILTVNLVTDVLPAAAVAMQQPENRDLAALRREGERDIDAALRAEILRRAWSTGLPTLGAYALATRLMAPAQARTVAFAGVVGTQLAQTLSVGWAQGTLTRPVLGAMLATGGFSLATFTVPPLAAFLGMAAPSPLGLALAAAAIAGSLALAGAGDERRRLVLRRAAAALPRAAGARA